MITGEAAVSNRTARARTPPWTSPPGASPGGAEGDFCRGLCPPHFASGLPRPVGDQKETLELGAFTAISDGRLSLAATLSGCKLDGPDCFFSQENGFVALRGCPEETRGVCLGFLSRSLAGVGRKGRP